MIKEIVRPYYYSLLSKLYGFSKYRPIFIVGCGHSGTTIMLRVLSSHSKIFGINYESHAFRKGVHGFKLFRDWEKERKKNNLNYWLEKTPRHVRYLNEIMNYFPNSKIIVMVRDGRDVAISIKKRYGNINVGINRWIEDNQKALSYKSHPNFIFSRLEDFTGNPAEEVKRICDLLDLKFSKEMLDVNKTKFKYENQEVRKSSNVKHGDGHVVNRNWQINQPIFKDTSRWKKEATVKDREAFENKDFIELLKKFHYSI